MSDKTTYILDCSNEPNGIILFNGEAQSNIKILARLNDLDFENRLLKAKFADLANNVRDISDSL